MTTNGDTSVSEDGGPEDEEEAATEDGWEQVGPKNKSVVTRAVSTGHWPIMAWLSHGMVIKYCRDLK